ncbi:4-hydroxythreonine-4-phosphate dehydrogenase PdxA [Brevundimonas sp.]|uniref:4-hydroxythreonine-4-phosphate dehydrogenase PdxA n=1 Tax=Brevundimonas sp. TaxID=1871086 RepID=UPI0025D136B6|nr:4-hydroxythreonine-4-phosphate dehydrogenase PdxA [Brevundimonas sp.]
MTPARPLALSLGDPAGVGPEIIAKAWRALNRGSGAFFVAGDADVLEAQGVPVRRLGAPAEAAGAFASALPVLHAPCATPPRPGVSEPANASAITGWIETAVGLALGGEASAVVTAPIAKAPLYAAGFRFPGHTEFIADLTANVSQEGQRGPVMMLAARDLRVCLVTIHVPLAEVPELVTEERVVRTATVAYEALRRDFGVAQPRLALAGLNPHAGESGALGLEEAEVLGPAVAKLRGVGINITDPLPADTLFHDEARRTYDAAICLYHDQGLIPVKTLDFWGGVNATLGLPIIRTSPDHGVGYAIAGQGVARPDSLIAAIRLASEMAERRTDAR